MKGEASQIIKGIILVIFICVITILICVKFFNKNYVYRLKYYEGENLYVLNITEDYNIKIDISVICKEEKCKGSYDNIVSTTNGIDKNIAKKVVEEFKLSPDQIVEINEKNITDGQRILLKKVIG